MYVYIYIYICMYIYIYIYIYGFRRVSCFGAVGCTAKVIWQIRRNKQMVDPARPLEPTPQNADSGPWSALLSQLLCKLR